MPAFCHREKFKVGEQCDVLDDADDRWRKAIFLDIEIECRRAKIHYTGKPILYETVGFRMTVSMQVGIHDTTSGSTI